MASELFCVLAMFCYQYYTIMSIIVQICIIKFLFFSCYYCLVLVLCVCFKKVGIELAFIYYIINSF